MIGSFFFKKCRKKYVTYSPKCDMNDNERECKKNYVNIYIFI